MDYWANILTVAFCTTRTTRSGGRNLPARKFLGTHFCYRLSGPKVDRRNRTPENVQVRNRKSNSEPPVLWSSTSTKHIARIRADIKYDMRDARDVAHTGQRINEREFMVGQHEVIETKRKNFTQTKG